MLEVESPHWSTRQDYSKRTTPKETLSFISFRRLCVLSRHGRRILSAASRRDVRSFVDASVRSHQGLHARRQASSKPERVAIAPIPQTQGTSAV